MGSSVSETIRKGISDVDCFENNPGLLMYGMTCVIIAVGSWLMFASYFEMPVSTTHSTVGGVIGMTLMSRGKRCVIWNYSKQDYGTLSHCGALADTTVVFRQRHNQYEIRQRVFFYFLYVSKADYKIVVQFPWLDGVAEIVVSWLLSPVASGICAAILYAVTKYGILIWQDRSYLLAKIAFPFIVAFTAGVNTVFWVVKGTKGRPKRFRTSRYVRESGDGDIDSSVVLGCYVGLGAGFVAAVMVYFIDKWIHQEHAEKTLEIVAEALPAKGVQGAIQEEAKNDTAVVTDVELADPDEVIKPTKPKEIPTSHNYGPVGNYVVDELNRDPHSVINKDDVVQAIHQQCRRYDPKTEAFFKYVQVFTAMVDSFSHGANDVANAMGPFSAAYVAYRRGVVKKETDLKDNMTWILAIGGAGIVVGLATYGYKIMTAMGVKLAAVTPSRGYCIELGAAFVIIYGTAQGWPLSTTHCQVGATVAVGLFEGKGGVNAKLLLRTCFGWIITLVVVGLMTALLVGPSPEPLKDEYCSDWAKVGDRGD